MSDIAAIKLKNITKVYKLRSSRRRILEILFKRKNIDSKIALNNLSFEINQGEKVAILGKNGSGKSTLLKLIVGVIYPTFGNIDVLGRIGALLELTAGFDPEFTGRQNIIFKGVLLRIPKAEMMEKMDDIIKFADLGKYIDQPVRTYSSGMKMRLGFSLNVNINPDILIVDEALSVGDRPFREKCRNKIKELNSENTTLLYVTHSLEEAKNLCDRALVLDSGTLMFDGDINAGIQYYKEIIK
ncbi:MAG: ABC transporter ATP-binding protein [Anaerovoracaceae bacterium]|nr:ABC transporter ATP-binding protein [Anaerovoracaceae bacterium]